jgi:hypothetical protein
MAAFPDEIIAPTMGHADTRMLERVYGKLSPEELSRRLLLHVRAALPDCIANASVGTELAGISRQAGRGGIANPSEVVPRGGIEPPTRGFSALSTPLGDSRFRLSRRGGTRRNRVAKWGKGGGRPRRPLDDGDAQDRGRRVTARRASTLALSRWHARRTWARDTIAQQALDLGARHPWPAWRGDRSESAISATALIGSSGSTGSSSAGASVATPGRQILLRRLSRAVD